GRVNRGVARIAVGLLPYLAGMQSTPFLRDALYTSPGYLGNLRLARVGVLPFLALVIVLTWVHARRAHGEAAAWVAAAAISCMPAILGHGGLGTTEGPFTAAVLLPRPGAPPWKPGPARRRAVPAGVGGGAGPPRA